MRSILQLCVMVLMLLGAGNRVWGKVAVGQNIAVRGFAEGGAFGNGVDEPPALMSSGEAAAWGYDCTVDVRDGPNVYAYVKQNPWSAFDSEGLCLGWICEAGLAIYDTYSYFTAKTPAEKALAGANLALDIAGAAMDCGDGGAGGGAAYAIAGRAALRIKYGVDAVKAVREVSVLTHAVQAGTQAGNAASDHGSQDAGGASPPASEPPPPTPGGQSARVTAQVAAKTAEERAAEIHGTLKPGTQSRTTTAVTETKEGIRVVSSSEKRLRPAQRAALKPGEVEGVGAGHAEPTGVNAAKAMGLTPTGTAASRPICRQCAGTLMKNGIEALSKLK